MNIFFSPEAHIARAEALLADSSPESLAYAAFELRCATEARLLDYAEFAGTFRKNPHSKWRVKDLAQYLDKVYSFRGAAYTVTIFSEKLPTPLVISYHPVSKRALKIVGQTDNFLHSEGFSQLREESKMKQLRSLLEEGVKEMRRCISGGLQGPLMQCADGSGQMQINADKHPEVARLIAAGDQMSFKIEVTPLIDSEAL